MKLKHILRLQYGSSLSADVRQEGSVPVYGSNGPVGFHDKSNMLAPAIVVGRKGSHGKVVWAENGGFCIDTAFFVDHRSSFTNLRFAYYLLQTLGLDDPSKDSAVPGLDRSEAYNKYVLRLSLETQKAIADFLDRETARIDQLIEKKQRLVELLGEKERATLEMLMTEIKAPIWRLRHLGSLKGGAGFPIELQGNTDGEVPFFKVKHLRDFGLDARLHQTADHISRETAKELRATIFPEGTIVFAKIGAALLMSRFSMLGVDACIDNNMSAFTPLSGLLDPEFALLALSRIEMSFFVQPGAVPSLNIGAFLNFPVARPETNVQRAVVSAFRQSRDNIVGAISKTSASIDRLRELRSALITAAVTGQVDVATYGKRGTTDRRLDVIESNMAVAAQPERQQARV